MFSSWLSGKYKRWYRDSLYKHRIDHVGVSLVTKKYLRVVVIAHIIEWLRFTKHLKQRRLSVPSTVYAAEVQRYLKQRLPSGTGSRFRAIRASIRILIETDEEGNFPLRMRALGRPTTELFRKHVPEHLAFLRRHRDVTDKTISKRTLHLVFFTNFLDSAGVSSLKDIQAALIHDFLTGLAGRKARTIHTYASTLRGFLRWAYINSLLDRDLSPAAKAVRQYQHAHVPDVLTQKEAHAVLDAANRSTAIGRRDYAVLLLAARYGLRPSDIRKLRLDDIVWRSATITLRQSKTGKDLALPLLPDVSKALIAYLQHGRPSTQFRNIFVRHRAPFEPFAPNNNLHTIMSVALRNAGLENRSGRRGLYLFRHTLATRLLEAGQPIKTIGDVLGHATTQSTLFYTKVDLPALRTVAISIAEVLR
jgi:site-specific recombinase XerD